MPDSKTFEVVNPATGTVVRRFDAMTDTALDAALGHADATFREGQTTSFDQRAGWMRRAAEILRDRADTYGRLMAEEMGKPAADGRSEAEKCAWVCDYYAEHAEAFLASYDVDTDAAHSYVAYRPLGVILAVMPWNFPFWQVFRFAVPNLMAGNTGLLKHASNVPGCALAIEDIFREAGFPEHAFRTLLIGSDRVAGVIADRRVRGVTLTGSGPAGRSVAAEAGKNLKKCVLELGGSDPYVVLADADIEHAAETCATSRLINSGQSCIAAKRFIAVADVYDEFLERVVEHMRSATVGDPMDEETEVGPQARRDLRDALHEQVQETLDAGARCILGGDMPDGPGAYYPPSVLVNIPEGTPAYDDELFGPVASVFRAEDEADALRIANASPFGLGAAVFTSDAERGEQIAERHLEAGCCFVNAFVRSDPRLPFGGVKESGFGRELARQGIHEFVNIKTVYRAAVG